MMSSYIQMQLEFKGPALTKLQTPTAASLWEGLGVGLGAREAETTFHLWPTLHTLSQETWGKHYNLWVVFIFYMGVWTLFCFNF